MEVTRRDFPNSNSLSFVVDFPNWKKRQKSKKNRRNPQTAAEKEGRNSGRALPSVQRAELSRSKRRAGRCSLKHHVQLGVCQRGTGKGKAWKGVLRWWLEDFSRLQTFGLEKDLRICSLYINISCVVILVLTTYIYIYSFCLGLA